MNLEQIDMIAGWASLVLTLMVFSYLLADNFLYRIAVHILVGAAAAFVAIGAIEEIVVPWVDRTITNPQGSDAEQLAIIGGIPFLLLASLLMKSTKNYQRVGNLAASIIIGVGTGVALVGILTSTVFPLIEATGESFSTEDELNASILVLGTITTLAYFQYVSIRKRDGTSRRPLPLQLVATIGQGFIAVTFGALYAGAILTSITIFNTVMNEQLRFVLENLGG